VDIIALVLKVGEKGEILVKSSGESKSKRSIILIDDSCPEGMGIDMTLWGELSELDLS